ncbi:hypothetical protein EMPS_07834 [Entomortierella parvispora]|uniref:Uncharacterized protein n=1 Tax=Entomortierella parvispora TaxID=205924 RepID=A0A9P3LYI4_9FUNG|nr:hypothetical protein EMPS_07834 [Entomortierella parvispora]
MQQSPPSRYPFYQNGITAPPESPQRRDLFRLGFGNYDLVSVHLELDPAVHYYHLYVDLFGRRQDPIVEGGIGEELQLPLPEMEEV